MFIADICHNQTTSGSVFFLKWCILAILSGYDLSRAHLKPLSVRNVSTDQEIFSCIRTNGFLRVVAKPCRGHIYGQKNPVKGLKCPLQSPFKAAISQKCLNCSGNLLMHMDKGIPGGLGQTWQRALLTAKRRP